MVSRLSILFLILFATVTFAQKGNKDLDSLLLECNFPKLQEALKNAETSDADSYQEIISILKGIPKLDGKDMLIEQAKAYKDFYTDNYVGIYASKAFAKFEESSKKGNRDEAVTYFYIARFFKNNFILDLQSTMDKDFREAQKCFNRREFNKSIELCQNIEAKFEGSRFIAQTFKDSVKIFRRISKEKFMIDEKEKKDWSREEKNNYNFSITIGGGLLYYPSYNQYDMTTVLKDPIYGRNIPLHIPAKLKREVGFGYSFSAGYRLLDYLSLNFSYYAGSLKYKELELPQTTAKTSLEVKNSDFLLSARYYLKTTAGLCPYIGLGYGYSSFKRSSFSTLTRYHYTIPNYGDAIKILELSMTGNSFSTTMMNAAFGLDYIASAESHFMYNVGFSFDKASQTDYFLKGYKLSVGLYVGVLL